MKFDELKGLVDSACAIRIDPVSELTLNHLMNIAKRALEDSPRIEGNREVTAVITTNDKIYTDTTGDPQWGAQLINKLKEQADTQVTHLITWIQSYTDATGLREGLELPSYTFRKMLIDLDEKNQYALLVMQGHERLVARTIGSTMPEKKTAE